MIKMDLELMRLRLLFFIPAQDGRLLSTENEKSSFVTGTIILDGGLKLIQIYNRQPHP